ncbi:MAG: type II toxin-antitoxin system HicA family toxin [Bacteroidales bacterium]|nr:type II toxin-antitoxin system HicA family toxin [Bacteroidales bacterium]MCI2121845.1 type II toxin-antitoxin system HicA family toxin [Bacteroidales bacterium]MCI2146033.1 type II toxin-antitoxin system HicA family toxin [Bacteroidales bacterium]
MKTSELIKILKANGCYLKKNGHKHDIWFSPKTGQTFAIPRHKGQELPKGTEKKD